MIPAKTRWRAFFFLGFFSWQRLNGNCTTTLTLYRTVKTDVLAHLILVPSVGGGRDWRSAPTSVDLALQVALLLDNRYLLMVRCTT